MKLNDFYVGLCVCDHPVRDDADARGIILRIKRTRTKLGVINGVLVKALKITVRVGFDSGRVTDYTDGDLFDLRPMNKHWHFPSDPRVFVFGSNRQGVHGAGAAKYAHQKLDARWGIGEGRSKRTYAIPTCERPGIPLSIAAVDAAIDRFIGYALCQPHETFFISEIGCGFAGFTAVEIAPLFRTRPPNCDFPPDW